MKLNQNWRSLLCAFGLFTSCVGQAQDAAAPPPSAPPKLSAADLEKLVAPIALHPDPLIAIILPASVYPLEVVQAGRFVKDTNNIAKIDEQPWDENVKSVAKVPELIQKMSDDLNWTMELGVAFVDQQKELMDTIQTLRGKAQSAGVLKTTPQQVIFVTNTVSQSTIETQTVFVTNTVVQIQPSNPEVVYVPTYPPTIYYPPAVYAGPPPVLTFAAGVAVGAIIANNCDWYGGGIYHGHGGVNIEGDVNINTGNINTGNINTGNRTQVQNTSATSKKWQPDQSRMNSSGAKASTQSAQARGYSSGTTQAAQGNRATTQSAAGNRGTAATTPANRGTTPAQGDLGNRTAGAAPANRPATTPAARPSPSPSANRATPSQSTDRPAPSASNSKVSASGSGQSAFGGASSGASTRQSSNRGSASRGGGGGGGGRGGGR